MVYLIIVIKELIIWARFLLELILLDEVVAVGSCRVVCCKPTISNVTTGFLFSYLISLSLRLLGNDVFLEELTCLDDVYGILWEVLVSVLCAEFRLQAFNI